MTISVLIPAYNASAFIAETLDSALAQTLPADDILVVDDGSTDDTAAIAARFPAPVRVLSIPNSKLGAARNFGINQVQTEWIAFLDADDLWEPNKLARQMEELARYPDADICYTGNRKFRMDGAVRSLLHPILGCPVEQIGRVLYRGGHILPSSAIIRKSVIVGIGGFSLDPDVAEDWDLWLRLLHAGVKFASCPEPLLLYRIHSNSITSDKSKLRAKNTRVFREHIVPRLSGTESWIRQAQFFSLNESEDAYYLRDNGDQRCFSLMTSSILRWPFDDFTRYKVWLHMALTRVGIIRGKGGPVDRVK